MSIARDFLYASAQKLSGIVHLHIKTLEIVYMYIAVY